MNHKITNIPTRMESVVLRDYWKDLADKRLAEMLKWESKAKRSYRQTKKWQLYFWLLILINITVIIYFLLN
jgi:hypothetical protein